mmetsp:Transcript_7461/g.15459  ORF Transcript_7461/g.15459 Transcript_7461/m.15459 type:complete len:255 (-) Transcript_7461:389-1153(-)
MNYVVSFGGTMEFLDTFPSQHQFCVCLGTLWNLHLDFASQGSYVHRASENGLGDGNRSFGVHIGAVSNEIVVFVDQHLDQQISSWSSRITFRALSAQTQIHPVVDPRRCVHSDVPLLDFNRSIFSVHHLVSQMKVLGCTLDCFLKGQPNVHLQVGTSLGPSSSACSTAKKGVKQFLRIDFSAAARVMEMKASGSTEWVLSLLLLKVGVCGSVSKLVIHFSLFVVADGFVRRCGLFEFFGSRCIVLIRVWVILFS